MNSIFNWAFQIKNETPFDAFISQSLVFIVIIIAIGFLLERLIQLAEQKKAQDLKLRDLEIENLKFKIEQLEEQFKPHFIFNAFNNLASLIHLNPQKAENYTLDLADFFRQLTVMLQKQSHCLADEINFNLKYLELEKVRLGSSIRFTHTIQWNDHWQKLQVPTSVLQPLFENAIKYSPVNLSSTSEIYLNISEKKNDLQIELINSFKKDDHNAGTKNGFHNVKKRLEMCLGSENLKIQSQIIESEYRLTILISGQSFKSSEYRAKELR